MRVLMLGLYDRGYPRNRSVAAALRSAGGGEVEVEVAHRKVWEKLRVHESPWVGFWARGYLGVRLLWAMVSLVPEALWKARRCDVIWVGFPGHTDVPLAGLIGKLTGRPVVFDAFISWYDSAVRDRKLFPKKSWTAKLLRFWDYWSCKLSDRVVVDTPEHELFFRRLFHVRKSKMMALPVGVDEKVFAIGHKAAEAASPRAGTPLRVLQYAEYTPLHGGEWVLEAARRLAERGVAVEVEMVGDQGPWTARLKQRTAEMGLTNVRWSGYVPERELVEKIVGADVVLGVFGDTAKARRVVPNKVVQGLAMGRCVLTAATPAVRRELAVGVEVAGCAPGSGIGLADEIERLAGDPALRGAIAAAGRKRFEASFSTAALGAVLEKELEQLVAVRERVGRVGRVGRVRRGVGVEVE
ncbi:MAG: glycosyltransferase [Planctomycetota bacterium]